MSEPATSRPEPAHPPQPRRRGRTFTADDTTGDLLAEIARLTDCLLRANSGFAHYEARSLMADHALEDVLEMVDRPPARVDVPAEVRAIVLRYQQSLPLPPTVTGRGTGR